MSAEPESLLARLTWFDIVAIVGAAAWLPHVLTLLRRPKVTVIPGGNVELGFTAMGPLFNPTLAFRTQHKDALVSALEFDVRHERGQRARFKAVHLVETGAFTTSSSGDSAIHQRTTSTIAIVLSPSFIAERKVNSREADNLDVYGRLMNAFLAAVRRLQNPDAMQWQAAVLKSAECHALREFLHNEFFWQPGAYRVTCTAEVADRRAPATAEFAFTLDEGDIERLRGNRLGLEWEFRRLVEAPIPLEPKQFPWQWLYPQTRPT